MEKKINIRVRAIILDDDKLLVVKHAHDPSFAALPGGHLEWGENIKECLAREIMEELGVKPEIGRLLYINNFIEKGITQSVEFFFEVINADQFKDIEHLKRTHAHEIAAIAWVTSSDSVKILPERFEKDFKTGKVIADHVRYI